MSVHRKRSYHFTILRGRKWYEASPSSPKAEPLEGAPVRVVVEAPKVTIEVPASVEAKVLDAACTPPQREELLEQLAEAERRLRIRRLAEKQGLTKPGDLGSPEEIWGEIYDIRVLKYNLGMRTKEGFWERHPGPRLAFMRAHGVR